MFARGFIGDKREELFRVRVEREKFCAGDFEEPTVEAEGAVGEAFLDTGITVQIFQSKKDVFFPGGGDLFGVTFEMRVLSL